MTWTLQLTRQDLALIATGLYYAERANLLAFRLRQRPPHTHDYELTGEIQ